MLLYISFTPSQRVMIRLHHLQLEPTSCITIHYKGELSLISNIINSYVYYNYCNNQRTKKQQQKLFVICYPCSYIATRRWIKNDGYGH